VDVAVTYEPYISTALAENSDLSLLYSAAERPGLISDVLVIRADLDPQTATALLKVWDEALAFYQSNPDEAKAIIAAAVGSTAGELQTAFDGVQFYTLAESKAELFGQPSALLADVAEVAKSIGLFETLPDLTRIVDTSMYP
jgi:NitT/TauT family transport system substrate-binding protein